MHPVGLLSDAAPGDVVVAPPREYTRREFLATAKKTANFLRLRGVHGDSLVAVTADATPESLLAFFGAAFLGARVRFGPPASVDARAVVGPTEKLGQFELPAGGQRIGYGAEPADASWAYFERDVWSENPTFPPGEFDERAPLLETGRESYSAGALADAAGTMAARYEASDVVAVRAALAHPGTVVAGVLAPLAAGATILLPDDETTGTVAVARAASPEGRRVNPGDVDL